MLYFFKRIYGTLPLYDLFCIIAFELLFGFFEPNVPCTENLSNNNNNNNNNNRITSIRLQYLIAEN
jgi:hypothetical protein